MKLTAKDVKRISDLAWLLRYGDEKEIMKEEFVIAGILNNYLYEKTKEKTK